MIVPLSAFRLYFGLLMVEAPTATEAIASATTAPTATATPRRLLEKLIAFTTPLCRGSLTRRWSSRETGAWGDGR